MRKKFIILIGSVVTLCFSATGWAVGHFEGHWVSKTGKVTSNIGINGDCTKVEILITQDEHQLLTKSYRAECGTYSSDWGPVPEEIHGGQILEGGDQVGTIDDKALKTSTPDSGVLYNYNLELQGAGRMHSTYGTQNFVGSITIEADMVQEP